MAGGVAALPHGPCGAGAGVAEAMFDGELSRGGVAVSIAVTRYAYVVPFVRPVLTYVVVVLGVVASAVVGHVLSALRRKTR